MIKKIIPVLLVVLLISCDTNSSLIGEEKFRIDIFPNGNFEIDFVGWYVDKMDGNKFEISNENTQEGNKCAKITLTETQRRAEISRSHSCDINTEVIYRWYYKIDENYKDSDASQTIHQFHDQPDFSKGETWQTMIVRYPPIYTDYKNNRVTLKINTIDGGLKSIGSTIIPKGEWIEFEYHCRWSLGDDGFISAKVNGEYITPNNGDDYKYYMPTAYNNESNYFKVGLYRNPSIKDNSIIYVDNVRMERIIRK